MSIKIKLASGREYTKNYKLNSWNSCSLKNNLYCSNSINQFEQQSAEKKA